MTTRRRSLLGGAAALIVGIIVIGLATYWDTYAPPPAGYTVSDNDREITVGFCGTTADTIEGSTFGEDDRGITVGVRLRAHRGFTHGIAHKVTFVLRTPIGDRIVRDAGGNAVPRGSYVCPG